MKRALLVLLALCGSARAGGILTTGPGITLRCATGLTLVSNGTTWTCSASVGDTGSGTTNYVTKWTNGASGVLGNSSIVDNAGARSGTNRQDVLIGNSGVFDLSIAGAADTNANAYIFQNAYEKYNTGGDATLFWQATNGSFGTRGIAFKFADGISFYADGVATTANTSFTPTRRMFIANSGNVTVDQGLAVNGTTGNPTNQFAGITWFLHTGSTPDFYVAGKAEFGLSVTFDNHVANHVANGAASDDVAAFGQISTAVNAAVSGSIGHLAYFNAANSVATASPTTSAADTLVVAQGTSTAITAQGLSDATYLMFGANQDVYLRGGKAASSINIGDVTNTGGVNIGSTTNTTFIMGAATINQNGGVTTIKGATSIISTATSPLTISNTTQLSERERYSGQEYLLAGNTSTDGVGVTLFVNRTGRRRLMYYDTALGLTQSASNMGLWMEVGASDGLGFDVGSTNGAVAGTLFLQQQTAGPTQVGGTLTAAGAATMSSTLTQTAGNITLNTSSGTTAITGHGATNLSVADATTAIAADIKNFSSANSATLNTTAAVRNSYGAFISNSTAISAGANTLTSIGAYIDDTTSGANTTVFSLYTDHGDVRLNATNGITGIKGPLNVDNTNSSATATSAQFNYTATAQTGSGAAALGTNSGTFNTTAGTITSYGLKGSATSTRSSGANNLVNVGLYGTASGAQLNYASYLDGDERIKGHELFNTAGAPTGSGCTLDGNSTDALGLVTMSTASTTLCTVTFNTAFPVTPFCTCSGGNNGTVQALADCEGASTTTMTIHAGTATSVGKFTYRCGSHE